MQHIGERARRRVGECQGPDRHGVAHPHDPEVDPVGIHGGHSRAVGLPGDRQLHRPDIAEVGHDLQRLPVQRLAHDRVEPHGVRASRLAWADGARGRAVVGRAGQRGIDGADRLHGGPHHRALSRIA